MGASLDSSRLVNVANQGQLRFTMKISAEELQSLKSIVHQRSNFKYLYLCSVERLQYIQDQTPNVFCQNFNEVRLEYQPYDLLLSDHKQSFPIQQQQIQRIIYAVTSALLFLQQQRHRHGDISTKMICKTRNQWKLIDNYFIRNGITAYEKVLQGEDGFISPSQMDKIRHGFVRESPPIEESDDVFALGMTCLQMMTGRPSTLCYKESYIRFNQNNFNQAIYLAQSKYSRAMSSIVMAMLSLSESKRISLRDIAVQPFISRHSKKYSLKTSSGR